MNIGYVSKLLSMSPETIRFYEKQNIIHPVRREGSTYRDYSIWDIYDLYFCSCYRNIGFSVKEISHMIASCSLDELIAMTEEKQNLLSRNNGNVRGPDG